MAYDYDSDEGERADNRYYSRGNSNKPSSSILKNSHSNKKTMRSDDEDDDDNYNSGRLSNSKYGANSRYDSSPINSHRSESKSASKPPSGRMQPLQPISSARSSNEYGKKQPASSSSGHFKSGGFNDDPDSDDSFMQRYQKFSKNKTDTVSSKDYTSKHANKYDLYDEDEKSK